MLPQAMLRTMIMWITNVQPSFSFYNYLYLVGTLSCTFSYLLFKAIIHMLILNTYVNVIVVM